MVEGTTLKTTGRAWNSRQPRHEREFCAKVPWGLACQEMALFLDRQLGNPLQVKFDTDGERFLDFVQRRRERCDIQVDADRFPIITGGVRIAFEVKGHIRLPGFHMVKGGIYHQNTKGWHHMHGVAAHDAERTLCHTE